jgi:hypothetical protein
VVTIPVSASLNNKNVILKKVLRLHTLFAEGKIPTLPRHEVNPGLSKDSRENYLYFTLPPCLNFQRSSPAMWRSALATYEDPVTAYLFFPEEVVKQSREKVQKDLVKHKLALQKNRHTDIWRTICRSLQELYDGDPRNLLAAGSWDVVKIHGIIRGTQKDRFPYLRGPKMANYWLYILAHYTDAQFANMAEISIIPDTHVLQGSAKLGLTSGPASPETVAQLWKELLAGSGLTPVEMHPVLWNWSRNHFLPNP